LVACRGIRGATTVGANTRDEILRATRELLRRIVERNAVAVEDIASIFFTVSDDLDAEYPALAARQLGWTDSALLCAREIPVPGQGVQRCIRVLLLANTERAASELRHVYLHEAVALRPSRADTPEPEEDEHTDG
jgi:chorismate mutase